MSEDTKSRKKVEVPVWKKYAISITEGAQYFSIGENKLRNYINQHPNAEFVISNGSHVLIKRKLFEQHLDAFNVI